MLILDLRAYTIGVLFNDISPGWAVVVHACNPSTLGGRGRQNSEFESSLVYIVSSRTARAIQRNTVSKKPNPKKEKKRTFPLCP